MIAARRRTHLFVPTIELAASAGGSLDSDAARTVSMVPPGP